MNEKLRQAREYSQAVRFSRDHVSRHKLNATGGIEDYKDHLLRSGLLINESLTPVLAEKFDEVCGNLSLPSHTVSAFITSSADIQATCVSASPDECVVHFSSGLVNLLEIDEFAFVVGHELGHFLLEHGSNQTAPESLEFFMMRRAQEISVDRFGLIGSGDLNTSLRALIKTASGLESRFLKLDVGQFISQATQLSEPHRGEGLSNTHPSILVRCRALLWFSMDDAYKNYPISERTENIDDLDRKVEDELDKFVEGPVREKLDETKQEVALWMAAQEIIRDGKFDKKEQNKFHEMFGQALLEKMKGFFADSDRGRVLKDVESKASESKRKLQEMMPSTFDSSYSEIKKQVDSHFG